MKPYPKYQQTRFNWLGSVPEHWKASRYKFHLQILCGYPFKSELFNHENGFPLIRIRDITSGSISVYYQGEFEEEYVVGKNHLLVGMDGDFNVRWWDAEDALLNQRCCSLIPNDNLFKRYLYYVIPIKLLEVNDLKYFTTVKHLSTNDIFDSEVFIPPLPEQKAIADFLDRKTGQIDKLIGIKEKQIELLKEQRTALINQAVTKGLNPNTKLKPSGIEWLGDIPEDWQVIPLKYMLKTTKGYAFKSADFCDSGVRVVRATDIKNGSVLSSSVFLPNKFLESHSQVRLNSGDLIISTVGSNPDVTNSAVGQVGLVPEELDGALLNQNTVILYSIDDRLCSYLLYILNSTSYRKFLDLHAHGTANQSSLKLFDILKFKAAIPPLEEQKLIVESIEKNSAIILTEREKLQKQIELLKEYRTALISEAVTGKIDVREDS